MKKIIVKTKIKTRNLPWRIVIGEKEIFDKESNSMIILSIGPNLASNVQRHEGILYEKFLKYERPVLEIK